MNSPVRTFKAATIEDALAQIRREMGLDAVIVETRQVERKSLLPWKASQNEFEVKATRTPKQRQLLSDNHPSDRTQPAPVGADEPAANREVVNNHSSSAKTLLRQTLEKSNVVETAPASNSGSHVTNRVNGNSFERVAASPVKSRPVLTAVPSEWRAALPGIDQRLITLQQMIADLGRRSLSNSLVQIPAELFPHYLRLIEADVEDETARELVARMKQHAAAGQLSDPASASSLLTALVEREFRCADPIIPRRGQRQVAMLVGPTGVGKTTTIAKLAGRFGLSRDLRVGLITVDTYRVAAAEQLRAYADIIALPMQVVSTPEEMQAALNEFQEMDLVLIDTAGRSPRNEQQMNELRKFVEAANPDHVCLVLSLSSGTKSIRLAAECFSAVRPTSLILTKLDEATGAGVLLSVARDIVLPTIYLTAGQEVPRDIEPANSCRFARLILSRDEVTVEQDVIETCDAESCEQQIEPELAVAESAIV